MFPFFVHCSSFVPLPVWLAPSFVRLLFVIPSSFVRHSFVFCSSFVRHLFVFASLQFPLWRGLGGGYFCLFSICPCGSHRLLFVFASLQFPLFEGVGGGYLCLFIICLCGSHYLPILLGLPVRLTPLTLHFLLNCFPILIKILHRDFFSVKANIFKLFCYLTAFAYNDDSEVF